MLPANRLSVRHARCFGPGQSLSYGCRFYHCDLVSGASSIGHMDDASANSISGEVPVPPSSSQRLLSGPLVFRRQRRTFPFLLWTATGLNSAGLLLTFGRPDRCVVCNNIERRRPRAELSSPNFQLPPHHASAHHSSASPCPGLSKPLLLLNHLNHLLLYFSLTWCFWPNVFSYFVSGPYLLLVFLTSLAQVLCLTCLLLAFFLCSYLSLRVYVCIRTFEQPVHVYLGYIVYVPNIQGQTYVLRRAVGLSTVPAQS